MIILSSGLLIPLFSLFAQRVYYCEPYTDRFTLKEELLGKVGAYYWVETLSRRRVVHHSEGGGMAEERSFMIYDTHMRPVSLIGDISYQGQPVKEYLLCDNDHFDQLHLLRTSSHSINIWVERFAPDGQPSSSGGTVGVFPFDEPGTSFLLVRSSDRQRMLLLGFQFQSASSPLIHAFLFDRDWRLLSRQVYRHPWLTQPMIQDDVSAMPLEEFNPGAVKLANSGDWVMAAPSRVNGNFLMFHFTFGDTAVVCKEVRLPAASGMEDVCLSVDNERQRVMMGVVSAFHYSALKNVSVVHYSLVSKQLVFDSSYRLTTLARGQVRNNNMVKESFIAVPGRGFILMKEYGRVYEDLDPGVIDEGWDPALLFAANDIPAPVSNVPRMPQPGARYGYARWHSPVSLPVHERGDLSLYYFPAGPGDSCWSGLISQEQVTEFNSPNLSYMTVPIGGKIFFLYNSFVRGENLYASSTVLDPRGELVTDQGVPFWGLKTTLDFQQSRQIGPDQLVIPYERYDRAGMPAGKIGFAVVLFGEGE